MKNVFCLMKKVIFSILFLYYCNFFLTTFNLIIPINIITVLIISLFDFSGIVFLIFILKLFY